MKRLLFALATCYACATVAAQQPSISKNQLQDLLTLANVDPLDKIFKETAFFDTIPAVADVARGEHASFQFVLRSSHTIHQLRFFIRQAKGSTPIIGKNAFIGFVGYTRVGRPLPNPSKDKLNPTSGFYPDPILDASVIDLPYLTTQPLWISIPIPVSAEPGIYTGTIIVTGIIEGKKFTLDRTFSLVVHKVMVPKTSLWVTNWFGLDKNQLMKLSGGKDSVEFSGNYWNWLKVVAQKMKEYNQNVVMTPVFALVGFDIKKDEFNFDFAKFDRFVQTFIDEGTIGRIEGGHIGGRMGNWDAQFGVFTPYLLHDSLRFKNVAITDPDAQHFYRQFIPALMRHLREKKWDQIYLQHICDEPEPGNEKSYGEIAGFIKSIDPEIKLIDAVHSHGVNNTVDVWVPQLDFFDADYEFYKERKAAGNEIWFYTCLAPQGEYANRYIELPLIKTRILHWINFRYSATGYLHWGWDFWSANPLEETSGIIPEAGNIMPGGDAFITYPGHGKILSSLRLEAMRDGIYDYELLRMLEEKQPVVAKEMCRQIVYGFSKYDTDIRSFREKRKRLLELLSD